MAPTPEIAVVVPSHRSERTIEACLDGLLRQTLSPARFEVQVVGAGEDGTARLVADCARTWDGRLSHIHVQPSGPGNKRNLGAERTSARFLAFTDSDCVPDPAWLEAGLARLDQGAAIVQGPTLTPEGTPPPPFSHAIFRQGPSPLFESCNVMYEARAFREAGGFPVELFDTTGAVFGEDTQLAWRVQRHGGAAVFEPAAVVRHLVHPPDFSRHLRYQWQARFFPRLLLEVPELRRRALTAGLFLSASSLRSSAAIAGLLAGARNRGAFVLALPYAAHLGREGLRAPSPRSAVASVGKRLLSDGVRQLALIWGSLRYRSPVL